MKLFKKIVKILEYSLTYTCIDKSVKWEIKIYSRCNETDLNSVRIFALKVLGVLLCVYPTHRKVISIPGTCSSLRSR